MAEPIDPAARLRAARLYVLVPLAPPGPVRSLHRLVEAAIRGGADMIQLREKTAPDAAVLAASRELVRVCRDGGALLIVNDRVAVARDAGADGVHLGQEDAAPADARAALGPLALIGLSTHDATELDRALAARAAGHVDHVGVGSLYPTATKGRAVPVGGPASLAPLAARAEASGVPAFGIGGIDAVRAPEVRAAGFRRIAVSAAVVAAADPEAAARALRTAIGG